MVNLTGKLVGFEEVSLEKSGEGIWELGSANLSSLTSTEVIIGLGVVTLIVVLFLIIRFLKKKK